MSVLVIGIIHSASAQYKQQVKNVAIFIHEGVELFDFAGPGEVFVAAGRQSSVFDFNVYTVAASEEQVTSQTFLKVIPNYSIDNCPPPDIIVLPGGSTSIPLKDERVITWIKEADKKTDITLSVCTGAFLLGKAGLLEGLKATTHWGSIERLRQAFPNTEVLENTKYVDNGKIVTSGGVSSGTEGSLHVVSRIAGEITAQKVARYMEYDSWDDRVGLVENESTFIAAVKSDGLQNTLASNLLIPFYGELLNLGRHYLEEDQAEKAFPLFEYLSEKYPVTETFEYLGKTHEKLDKEVPVREQELIALIEKGEVDEAMKQFHSSKKTFPMWQIIEESTINRLGYALMTKDETLSAVKVFAMNTEEFPNSFNAWDSLAEGYLKLGDTDLARKHYQKSLELNPNNTNAENALASIK
ncbi:MAG: DJ-1/PfpI family protein [Cyclobacteriaceae bacterium]